MSWYSPSPARVRTRFEPWVVGASTTSDRLAGEAYRHCVKLQRFSFLISHFGNSLSQDAVQQESNDRNSRYQDQQQGADKERCLPAGFLGRLGDAEGVDEGVGQEVKQGHALLCANIAAA